MLRSARRLLIAAAAFAAAGAQAAPVSLSVSGFSFTPGAGYGVDADEGSGTLLDVVFGTGGFAAQAFTLGTGDSLAITLGSVQLREPNAMGAIVADETDALDVGAMLSFAGLGGTQALAASGTAAVGAVSDSAVDLSITWAPLVVDLGNGDLLDITLDSLQFTGLQTLTQTATLTLRQAATSDVNPGLDLGLDVGLPPAGVPEPASLLLAGLALAALAGARRR